VLADNTKACPKLREACKNDAGATQIELREPFSFHAARAWTAAALAALWILLGLGLGMLVFALVRHFLDHKSKDDVIKTQAPGSAEDDRAAALARQVETDVQRLLERARAEAMAGDFRAAIGDAYAALLRRLEGAGVVRVEPDQTNGDYRAQGEARAAGHRAAWPRWSAPSSRAVRRAAVTREEFRRRLCARDGASRRTHRHAAGAGVAARRHFLRTAADDWDHSPSGRAGVIDYLGKRGFKVHERLLSLAKIPRARPINWCCFPALT
jgi:hypothetical protein